MTASDTWHVLDLSGDVLLSQSLLYALNGRQIVRTVGDVENLNGHGL
jgi:hypothetical protein